MVFLTGVLQVRGAIRFGVNKVLVPFDSAAALQASVNTNDGLTSDELKKVVFVENILEVFQHAIEGKQS